MPNPKARPKSKGKSPITPKVSKPIILRKPMPTTLSDFPILTRNRYKSSTSHAPVPLDHRKHSSVVINEKVNPNILQTSNDPSPSCMEEQNLPTCDPPDQSCMQKDATNGSTHPTKSSLQQSPLHEPNEALDDLPHPSIDSLSDLLNDNGQWDHDKLNAIFHSEAVQHKIGVKCPDPLDKDDCIVWRLTHRHNFETQSAYSQAAKASWDLKSLVWKHIWCAPVPQHLRVFLWTSFRNKLMTNLERCRWFISDYALCPLCNEAGESTIHILRDCAIARKVWLHLFLITLGNSLDFFFGHVITWASYYIDIVKLASSIVRINPLPTSWRQPDSGWTCLNVDEVVSPLIGSASSGGLFRNSSELWLLGFQKAVGTCHPLQAELWAIFTSLEIPWTQGFELLELQSDCVEAIKMVNSLSAERSLLPLVRAISRRRQRGWITNIHWISRDCNKPAGALAKIVDPNSHDVFYL
ncbi:hypothetical protein GQ457_12G028670 [Hibiscus cannabinus]